MHKFVRNLITEWRRLDLPFSGETLVVAVSGGADSISLLAALHELRDRKKIVVRIVVAHFNHNLRGAESDADEAFVKQITEKLGFELAVGHGKILNEGNLEQNARTARYAFLTETALNLKSYGVLTAHTMNDQAETFLMNLIRGSGVDGLSGMKVIRELNDETAPKNEELSKSAKPQLIRPLLNWAKRIDTENFCRENESEYRYDTMNEDMAFRRVRIRKMLIPMLVDFNPKIIETLAKTASLIPGSDKEIASVATDHGTDQSFFANRELTIKLLKSLSKPDRYRALRIWLKHKRGNLRALELKHIEAIERLVLSQKSGRIVELPNGESVVKQDGKLLFQTD